ncbi:MAG: hypothetical protein WC529_00020 [Candidatus Margulisiibacteriota bacterium]
MFLTWEVKGCPPSMKNDLDGRHRHRGGAVAQYKRDFALQTPVSAKLGLTGPVAVRLVIYKKDRRQDGVNMDDVVYDALQFAGVILNDRQIEHWEVETFVCPDDPRVRIWLQKIEEGTKE